MIIPVNLLDLLGIIKIITSNKVPLGQRRNQVETLGLKLERCTARSLVLGVMNIHQDYGSEGSYCDGSLLLKVDKMSVQKKKKPVLENQHCGQSCKSYRNNFIPFALNREIENTWQFALLLKIQKASNFLMLTIGFSCLP